MKTQTIMKTGEILLSSFRDPAGFVFKWQDEIYRQVNQFGREDYDYLVQSGLYDRLVSKGYLIPHQEIAAPSPAPDISYKILKPEKVPFISYPYEWSFSQLQDAAALTLRIQKHALKAGLSLKDSSAYNIQFLRGKPIFIDTLSFEKYQEGSPWAAYRQYCQQFLAPLAVMHYTNTYIANLLRVYLDGLPLPVASQMLPARARLNFGCLLHIFLHASSIQRYTHETNPENIRKRSLSKTNLLGLIDSLSSITSQLKWRPSKTSWGDYDPLESYSETGKADKSRLVEKYISIAQPGCTWDLGANQGVFSRISSEYGALTIAIDSDPVAVERHYQQCRQTTDANLLPLVIDLTNPSPASGWQAHERLSLFERGPADLVLALALEHHLVIGNNVPFPSLAEFFSKIGNWLVIEFIPKSDPQVQRMLLYRKDIFPDYHLEKFEEAFKQYFGIMHAEKIQDSERSLFLMKKKVISE
jgi:hypothetical protein